MSTHGIRTPEIVAHSMRGHYFSQGKEVAFSEWVKSWTEILGNVFVKNNTSCCGRGIYKVKVGYGHAECEDKNFSLSEAFFRDGDFIIQKEVCNHKSLSRIYPKSLNTARFITVWSEQTKRPELFAQFFRIGANGNVVDNWAVGGLLFVLNSDGSIGDVGFFKDPKYAHGYGMRVDSHPDTGVSFKGMRVPDYDAGLELALKAHAVLPTVKSIGWDVAFTDDGPLIVEGNDDWEIAPCQILTGGMRIKSHKYFGVRNVC